MLNLSEIREGKANAKRDKAQKNPLIRSKGNFWNRAGQKKCKSRGADKRGLG